MSQKHAGTTYARKDSRSMSPMPLFNINLKNPPQLEQRQKYFEYVAHEQMEKSNKAG